MLHDDYAQLITNSILCQELSPRARRDFLDAGYFQHASSNTFLFLAGEPATTFYIALSGKTRLLKYTPQGQQVILDYIVPGRYFGVFVALSRMKYPISAEVIEDSDLFYWTAETVRELILRHPQIALNCIELNAHRHGQLQANFQAMATDGVEKRIFHALAYLAKYVGKPEGEGVLIDMPLSRQDLAEMTGTNLYNVSRFLRKWEKAGLVHIGRRQVSIHNQDELAILVNGSKAIPQK